MLVELVTLVGGWVMAQSAETIGAAPMPDAVTNTHALGNLIYTHYIYLFQAAGIIMLVAMIGAIVLTNRSREGVKKQSISHQLNRDPANSVELRKVETGKGI